MKTPITLTLALAALLLAPAAHAFAPKADQGLEPNRIFRYDNNTQAMMAHQPAWESFVAGEGQGWRARFDQLTGAPHRMWGPGIAMDGQGPDAQAAAFVAFAERNRDALGLGDGVLAISAASTDKSNGITYVDVDVQWDGVGIWRGGLTARIKDGKLIMVGSDGYADVAREGSDRIGMQGAVASAIAQGPAPMAVHLDQAAHLTWLPEERPEGLVLRLCWLVESRTESPVGRWQVFVDAQTGEIAGFYNLVRFANGTVSGMHHERLATDPLVEDGMADITIHSSDGSVEADEVGGYTTGGDATDLTANLEGSYLRVTNEDGQEGSVAWSGGDVQFDAQDATQAEIDSYVFLHQIRDWGMSVDASNRMASDAVNLVSHVNEDDVCNAYYDTVSVNFFRAGQGCSNTGTIADVNYHEWGHGWHYWAILNNRNQNFDGSLSEGAADCVAFFQTRDSVVAPSFFTNNNDGIREVATNMSYPRDYVDNQAYVHSNGLIFGGAIWDMWGILEDHYGQVDGQRIAEDIYTNALKGGPTIETSFDEAVAGDDDDGDLGNNTPHYCDIVEAFALHGLGPSGNGGSAVSVVIDPMQAADAGVEIPVSTELFNVAAECFTWEPESAQVVYSVDGGDWDSVPLNIADGGAQGAIPAQVEGSYVEWYVEYEDSSGERLSTPSGGEINPFSFYVGGVIEIYADDFEDGDGGFTHALIEGTEALGADDWQIGVPLGEGGDPVIAHSGRNVWGNDLGDGDYNGTYQPEKTTRLTSPTYDMDWYQGAILQYWRWLSVEDATYDHARIYAAPSISDETVPADMPAAVWQNYGPAEDHQTEDRAWSAQSVDLQGAGDDGTLQVAFEIDSDEGLEFGGWNLDDVRILVPATPDNRLGIGDLQAGDEQDGGITVTFTNPRHAPVQRVVVVRSSEGYPTSATDGEVVWDDNAPELSAPIEFTDTAVDSGTTYYYAAYGYDGADWLSWTREGFNADTGSATGQTDGDGGGLTKGDCGCSAGGNASAPWFVAGLVGLLAFRRRRS